MGNLVCLQTFFNYMNGRYPLSDEKGLPGPNGKRYNMEGIYLDFDLVEIYSDGMIEIAFWANLWGEHQPSLIKKCIKLSSFIEYPNCRDDLVESIKTLKDNEKLRFNVEIDRGYYYIGNVTFIDKLGRLINLADVQYHQSSRKRRRIKTYSSQDPEYVADNLCERNCEENAPQVPPFVISNLSETTPPLPPFVISNSYENTPRLPPFATSNSSETTPLPPFATSLRHVNNYAIQIPHLDLNDSISIKIQISPRSNEDGPSISIPQAPPLDSSIPLAPPLSPSFSIDYHSGVANPQDSSMELSKSIEKLNIIENFAI